MHLNEHAHKLSSTRYRRLGPIGLLILSLPAWGQLQTGRDASGSLWLSDRGLPEGVKPVPLELDQVMSLPPPTAGPRGGSDRIQTPPPPGKNVNATRAADRATCEGIDQRTEEARQNLTSIERDKASGKLLIPDSGLVTIRQNLATLERLQALCR